MTALAADRRCRTTQAAALAFVEAGCSVLRVRADGSKAPAGAWEHAQRQAADASTVAGWFNGGHPGVGVVTGAVSGNLELLEFEGRAIAEGVHLRFGELADASGLGELWARIAAGYRETTPSGGVHLLYRVDDAPVLGNMKLARRPSTAGELREHQALEVQRAREQHADDQDALAQRLHRLTEVQPERLPQVLLETRGEGGFVVVAPSHGPVHPTGKPWTLDCGGPDTIPTVSAEEYRALHDLARALDAMPTPEPPARPSSSLAQASDDERPGDRFNRLASWQDLLTPHGWQPLHEHGGTLYWRRPGKATGVSATTGRNEHDRLYVFSTSTEFEAGRPYDKLGALALLEHGGDIATAARNIAANPTYGGRSSLRDLSPHAAVTAVSEGRVSRQADEPAPTTAAEVDPFAGFWGSRESLQHLHDSARARRTSPWAVLGVTLVRVITSVRPFVVLPPLVGSVASLNLFVALVGPSGSGKGAAEGTAADALDVGDVHVATAGSGEGIAHLYAHRDKKGEIVRDRDAVLLTVAEVDNLTALGARQGSTLLPVLRSAWSGERLGFSNADRARTIPLGRHTYRLGLVLGVQPGRASTLLGDSDGGTPQRFLWLPAVDPNAPDERPPMPPPRRLRTHPWRSDRQGQAVLTVPDIAAHTIDRAHLARARGDGDALDGHALLCRLKTAQALALLDDRPTMTDEDWHLAGVVMRVSDRTREHVEQQLATAAQRANLARGHSEGLRAAAAEEAADQQAVQRTCRAITRKLADRGATAHADLRKALTSRDRRYFDESVQRLVDAGQLLQTTTAHGVRYALPEGSR